MSSGSYNENFKVNYNVDLVFCIDATGSMEPIIGAVKGRALNFYSDVMRAMDKKKKKIGTLRIRVIAFRDYMASVTDGIEPMLVTEFFTLPENSEAFASCINSIRAEGGGDIPEDGLEALGYAIKSKWNEEGNKRRQVIVVWTDAPTHEIGFGKTAPGYPGGMAKTFSELTAWWGDSQSPGFISEQGKRLLLFTPEDVYWSTVSDTWNNTLHFPSIAGEGLSEYTLEEILDAIANSV